MAKRLPKGYKPFKPIVLELEAIGYCDPAEIEWWCTPEGNELCAEGLRQFFHIPETAAKLWLTVRDRPFTSSLAIPLRDGPDWQFSIAARYPNGQHTPRVIRCLSHYLVIELREAGMEVNPLVYVGVEYELLRKAPTAVRTRRR